MLTIRYPTCFLCLAVVFSVEVYAQGFEEEAGLARAFGDEEFISLATGSRQLIAKAPAVATVITADEIKAIGATDIDQVLETVPGLHVSVSPRAYNPLFIIRGAVSDSNPQVLVLVNDIPITNVYSGDRSQVWGGMSVNDIARIEVIRGPGSAVHGADAFAGTINIITKTADDIDGTEIGGRTGSFNYNEAWVLHGGRWNGIDIAASLDILSTDGADSIIDADAQTVFDTRDGTNASLAPNSVNLQRDNVDARLDFAKGSWRLRFGYQGRHNLGTGAGVGQALDPVGSNDSDRFNADLTYERVELKNWDLTAQLSYFDTSAKSNLVLYPPNTIGPNAFNPTPFSPDGMIGNPYIYERHTRFGVSGFYHGIEHHTVRIGTGYIYDDLYKVKETKNFDPFYFPLGSIVDATDNPSLVFIQPHDRRIAFAFAQDEWSIAPDWDLTGGIRYDHYSDFGNTVNPRLALVWQTRYNLTSKLLYGRAFRAPSFQELYNINNPVALGNPNLKPEIIDTVEVAFDYQSTDNLRYGLNVFSYKMRDILRLVSDLPLAPTYTVQNAGDQTGYGLEIEVDARLGPTLDLIGNFAYQHSTDEEVNNTVADAPGHQVYLRADWRLASTWRLDAQWNLVANRRRAANDLRPAIDDYTTTDITIRYKRPNTQWELAAAVKNLLDQDRREPNLAPGYIPNDLPLAGRTWFLEARYDFGEIRN